MPAGNYNKTHTPLSALPSMTQTSTATAIQSGPYTKAQFQSTMEGSRTVKDSKEVEHILRDYPAALELYRTGKYKVKVKCEAEIERVILVEKRTIKPATDDSTTTTTKNNTDENNQNVPEPSTNVEQVKEVEKDKDSRKSRSRTQSKEPIGPAPPITNGMNVVHATISSISMANNNQPKVDHQRTPSNEREAPSTPIKNQPNPADDNQQKASINQQQGNKVNREYPRTMVPYVPQACKPRNPWPQPQFQQPCFSNPLFQAQQRPNLSVRAPFLMQQNPQYKQPYYLPQRPTTTIAYVPQPPIYSISSTGAVLKPNLQSVNTYASRSITNLTALQPTFRTFQSSLQQVPPPPPPQVKIPSIRPIYQPQIPFPINQQLPISANEPISALMNTNIPYFQQQQQQRGARNRAHSVDAGSRARLPLQIPNIPQQPNMAYLEHYHHHHRRHHHHRPLVNPTNNVDPSVANTKETNVPAKERSNGTVVEKLTMRELNETFHRIDPSGRLPYNLLPGVLQRYGILSTENDLVSAAKDLEYNLTDPVSARRLIHLLIKLGKITKSNQQPRQPASPSMLPEDREVTDIMTQRNATNNQ